MDKFSQKPKWSKYSIVVTLLVIVVLCVIPIFIKGENHIVSVIAAFSLLFAMTVVAMFFIPVKLSVNDSTLCITFPVRTKSFQLNGIKYVKPYVDTKNSLRVFASGGYFGFWGWFWNGKFGRFMVYAKNTDCLILFELNNGERYVVSCSNPEEMADAMNKRIH